MTVERRYRMYMNAYKYNINEIDTVNGYQLRANRSIIQTFLKTTYRCVRKSNCIGNRDEIKEDEKRSYNVKH